MKKCLVTVPSKARLLTVPPLVLPLLRKSLKRIILLSNKAFPIKIRQRTQSPIRFLSRIQLSPPHSSDQQLFPPFQLPKMKLKLTIPSSLLIKRLSPIHLLQMWLKTILPPRIPLLPLSFKSILRILFYQIILLLNPILSSLPLQPLLHFQILFRPTNSIQIPLQ